MTCPRFRKWFCRIFKVLFFFLPARSPVPVGWEAALKQGAALPVRNSISHYREDAGWRDMVTQAGKVPLASASAGQHCKLFCMKSSHLHFLSYLKHHSRLPLCEAIASMLTWGKGACLHWKWDGEAREAQGLPPSGDALGPASPGRGWAMRPG